MPRLRVLKLNELNLDDAALADLPPLGALEHLELDGTSTTKAGLRTLLASHPQLRRVELRRTTITAEAVAEIRAARPDVELVRE